MSNTLTKKDFEKFFRNQKKINAEYRRWSWLFKKNYNSFFTTKILQDDSSSFLLALSDRSIKQQMACLFFRQTWDCFSQIHNIDRLMFSELDSCTQTNVMHLWSDNLTRYILPLDIGKKSGFVIGEQDSNLSSNDIFVIDSVESFYGYNRNDHPRLVIVLDILSGPGSQVSDLAARSSAEQ